MLYEFLIERTKSVCPVVLNCDHVKNVHITFKSCVVMMVLGASIFVLLVVTSTSCSNHEMSFHLSIYYFT